MNIKQKSEYLMLEAHAWNLLKKKIEAQTEALTATPHPDNQLIQEYYDNSMAVVEMKRLTIFNEIETL